MIRNRFNDGVKTALSRFHVEGVARAKISNMVAGAAGYNPALNGQAVSSSLSATTPKLQASPTTPIASQAGKSNILG